MDSAMNVYLAEAAASARDHDGSWIQGMLGALNILLSQDSSPEDLFLAHARWLASMNATPSLRQTAGMFCRIIQSAWLRVTSTPALIRQPPLNIPNIQQA